MQEGRVMTGCRRKGRGRDIRHFQNFSPQSDAIFYIKSHERRLANADDVATMPNYGVRLLRVRVHIFVYSMTLSLLGNVYPVNPLIKINAVNCTFNVSEKEGKYMLKPR